MTGLEWAKITTVNIQTKTKKQK